MQGAVLYRSGIKIRLIRCTLKGRSPDRSGRRSGPFPDPEFVLNFETSGRIRDLISRKLPEVPGPVLFLSVSCFVHFYFCTISGRFSPGCVQEKLHFLYSSGTCIPESYRTEPGIFETSVQKRDLSSRSCTGFGGGNSFRPGAHF